MERAEKTSSAGSASKRASAGIFALLALLAVLIAPQSAQGAPAGGSVHEVVIESTSGGLRSTLKLDFDRPISTAEATKLRSSIAPNQPSITVAGSPLWCNGYISSGDSNGHWTVQYYCGSPRTLPWGYQISASVQAIIVSSVSERGLSWWRNGAFAGQNSPHVVPKDYHFHGTMSPVYSGNQIDYNDYFTFRHNVGSGGTGSITLAGTVTLMN